MAESVLPFPFNLFAEGPGLDIIFGKMPFAGLVEGTYQATHGGALPPPGLLEQFAKYATAVGIAGLAVTGVWLYGFARRADGF